jgi:malonate transporter
VFQTTVRWNGFLAFAVAEKLFPPEGAAMVALVMAIIIIPINVESVAVVAWFTERRRISAACAQDRGQSADAGGTAALIVRSLPFSIPGPLMEMLNLVARAALGMGLMAIGAGLRPQDTLRPQRRHLAGGRQQADRLPGAGRRDRHAARLSGPQLAYLTLVRGRADGDERLCAGAPDGRRRRTLCGHRDHPDRRVLSVDSAGARRRRSVFLGG